MSTDVKSPDDSGSVASHCSIAVCCGTPSIWTFMFSGAEWFCRKCKSQLPMFNATKIDGTPELEAEKEANTEWFRSIAKDFIPRGGRLKGCDKCERGEGDHIDHASPEDLEKSKVAYAKLMSQ